MQVRNRGPSKSFVNKFPQSALMPVFCHLGTWFGGAILMHESVRYQHTAGDGGHQALYVSFSYFSMTFILCGLRWSSFKWNSLPWKVPNLFLKKIAGNFFTFYKQRYQTWKSWQKFTQIQTQPSTFHTSPSPQRRQTLRFSSAPAQSLPWWPASEAPLWKARGSLLGSGHWCAVSWPLRTRPCKCAKVSK